MAATIPVSVDQRARLVRRDLGPIECACDRGGHEHVMTGWEQVKAARAVGQDRYLEVVIRILAHSLDNATERDELMEPIWRQEDLVRAYRRTRRGALADVDPESGELLDDQADGLVAVDGPPDEPTA